MLKETKIRIEIKRYIYLQKLGKNIDALPKRNTGFFATWFLKVLSTNFMGIHTELADAEE